MIEHLLFLKFRPDASPQAINELLDAFRAMPRQIPGLRDATAGQDFGGSSQGYTHGLALRFGTRAQFEAYKGHPAHLAALAKWEMIKAADPLEVDYTVSDDGSTESSTGEAQRPASVARAYLDRMQSDPVAAVNTYMAPDVTYVVISEGRDELSEVLPWIGKYNGRDSVVAYMRRLAVNQPIVGVDLGEVLECGNAAIAFGRLHARGVDPERESAWDFAIRFDVADGRIVRHRIYEDSYAAARLQRRGGSWLVANAEAPNVERHVPEGAG